VKRARSTGSWVATPTGQVFRWHLRIMMQPAAISGARWRSRTHRRPAARRQPRPRAVRARRHPPARRCASGRPLSSRVCWVSARPISQGEPAWVSEVRGLAPVRRPSKPLMVEVVRRGTWRHRRPRCPRRPRRPASPRLRAAGLTFFRSWMSCFEILDRIDVVVRRRRDQADARGGSGAPRRWPCRPCARAAGHRSPGLAPWGHLDLDVVGVDQILRGHPEAPGRHLLDGRAHGIAVGKAHEAVRFLAALARCSSGRRCGSWAIAR